MHDNHEHVALRGLPQKGLRRAPGSSMSCLRLPAHHRHCLRFRRTLCLDATLASLRFHLYLRRFPHLSISSNPAEPKRLHGRTNKACARPIHFFGDRKRARTSAPRAAPSNERIQDNGPSRMAANRGMEDFSWEASGVDHMRRDESVASSLGLGHSRSSASESGLQLHQVHPHPRAAKVVRQHLRGPRSLALSRALVIPCV